MLANTCMLPPPSQEGQQASNHREVPGIFVLCETCQGAQTLYNEGDVTAAIATCRCVCARYFMLLCLRYFVLLCARYSIVPCMAKRLPDVPRAATASKTTTAAVSRLSVIADECAFLQAYSRCRQLAHGGVAGPRCHLLCMRAVGACGRLQRVGQTWVCSGHGRTAGRKGMCVCDGQGMRAAGQASSAWD